MKNNKINNLFKNIEIKRNLFLFWIFAYCFTLFFSIFSIISDIVYIIIPNSYNIISIYKVQIVLMIISMIITIKAIYNGQKVPKIKELKIMTDKKIKDFKVIQLTDLHIGKISNTKWLKKVIEKVNNENADIILITGDFADGKSKNYIETINLLSTIKSKNGVYAITGNHEYYSDYHGWMKLYEKQNIKFLFNEKISIDNFEIFGVPDIAAARFNEIEPDLKNTLKNQSPDKFRILLDHRPASFKENSELDLIDLQLSGHTHGGMVPGLKNLVAKMNNGYVGGVYKNKKAILNLSNGTGIWAGFPLRLNDDAEINVIYIEKKK